MGYYGAGDDPAGIITGEWKDSTNPATKNHVVRLSIGTARQVEFPHSAADLCVGVLQRTGTYHQELEVATEGIAICVNSKAGTIDYGDPIIYDHSNSGGTCGKVRSAFTSASVPADVGGTAATAGFYTFTDWVTLEPRPGSIRFGTAQAGVFIPDGANGTTIYVSKSLGVSAGRMYYMIDQPVIGFAMDKANSPQDTVRVKLARQWDIKNNSAT